MEVCDVTRHALSHPSILNSPFKEIISVIQVMKQYGDSDDQ